MVQFLPGLAVLIIEAALQISGYQNPHLAIGLLLVAALFLAIPAWSQLKRMREAWQFRSPFVKREVEAQLAAQTAGHAPVVKIRSKAAKERLSDLYDELSQLLLSNGGNGSGGLYMAVANLGNEFSQQTGRFRSGADLDLDKLGKLHSAAQAASVAMYGALYGENGVTRKSEYLVFSEEIRAVLHEDGNNSRIQVMQSGIHGMNIVLLALKSAQKHRDNQLTKDILEMSAWPLMEYHAANRSFQQWAFDASQSVLAARNLLRE